MHLPSVVPVQWDDRQAFGRILQRQFHTTAVAIAGRPILDPPCCWRSFPRRFLRVSFFSTCFELFSYDSFLFAGLDLACRGPGVIFRDRHKALPFAVPRGNGSSADELIS